jgi:hypothetical protein
MKQFLYYWTILARHPGYKRARIMALLTAISVGAMVYFATTDQFGWTLTLIIPFMILSTSTLDQLGWAFRSTAIAPPPPQYYDDYYEDAPYEDDDDEEGQYYEDEPYYEEGLPQVQIRSQGRSMYPPQATRLIPPAQSQEEDDEYADYWEGDEDEPPVQAQAQQNAELSYQQKLEQCQFYAFLYTVVKYRYVGEAAWMKLGVVQKQYREWVKLLASPELALLKVEYGKKPTVIPDTLEEALAQLENYYKQPEYWKYALWFFHDQPEAGRYWTTLEMPLNPEGQAVVPFYLKMLPESAR